jgi:hypothetical protein
MMAGEAAEFAVQYLKDQPRRIILGRQQLQQVIENLSHARDYLQTSGVDPERLRYVQMLIGFYQGLLGQLGMLTAPVNASKVANAIYGAQGSLLSAAPFLTNSLPTTAP